MAQCSPVPVSPMVGPGLRARSPSCPSSSGAAHGLSDHVEAHVVLVWALAKAFDLRVDETGIDSRTTS